MSERYGNCNQNKRFHNSLHASFCRKYSLYLKPIKMMFNEDTLENFIRENREKFGVYHPPDGHMEKFLFKIKYRIHYIISIVPYLIRLSIASILIFTASVLVWNNFIRRDRNQITLEKKITVVFKALLSHQNTKLP